MSAIDHFRVYAPDGQQVYIAVTQVVDDSTWFELYATGRPIGKLHWRADIDAYIALNRNGAACGSSPVLTEAEEALVREAGYSVDRPTVEAPSYEK